jgi:hypothetical protein
MTVADGRDMLDGGLFGDDQPWVGCAPWAVG